MSKASTSTNYEAVLVSATALMDEGRLTGARETLKPAIASVQCGTQIAVKLRLALLTCQLDVLCRLRWQPTERDDTDARYAREVEQHIEACLRSTNFPDKTCYRTWFLLGESAGGFERFADASDYFQRALNLLEAGGESDHQVTQCRSMLVGALLEQQEWQHATSLAAQNHSAMKPWNFAPPLQRLETIVDLLRALRGSGNIAGAKALLKAECEGARAPCPEMLPKLEQLQENPEPGPNNPEPGPNNPEPG